MPVENALDTALGWTTQTATVVTTLAAQANPAAVTISTVASVPIGTLIEIGPDAAKERRVTTNVSGAGPFTVTFVGGLVNTHASGGYVHGNFGPNVQAYAPWQRDHKRTP